MRAWSVSGIFEVQEFGSGQIFSGEAMKTQPLRDGVEIAYGKSVNYSEELPHKLAKCAAVPLLRSYEMLIGSGTESPEP